MLVKRCYFCGKYFEIKKDSLPNFKAICPSCLKNNYFREIFADIIKSQRYIPFYFFDVFDTDYPRSLSPQLEPVEYERVCRGCGARLRNQHIRRYCSNECRKKVINYLSPYSAKIRKIYKERKCEICGKTLNYKPIIHHIKPVALLEFENLHLIWDPNNLMGVCNECHRKIHKHGIKTQKIRMEYMDLTEFITDKKYK